MIKVICYGLGATDPKGIFGTTLGLEKKFGKERVFDMPTSENAMTGVAIGAAIGGYKTIMTHQRLDFFLLAMDQLVNGAAKMHYMFNGELKVPVTIRLILGKRLGTRTYSFTKSAILVCSYPWFKSCYA